MGQETLVVKGATGVAVEVDEEVAEEDLEAQEVPVEMVTAEGVAEEVVEEVEVVTVVMEATVVGQRSLTLTIQKLLQQE